jgi:murein L,D-transpeptidase YcbB/YkuD
LKDIGKTNTQPSLSDRSTEIDSPSDYLRDLNPEQVKTVQTMLGVEPDGKWGQDTNRAYQQYLQDNGLSQDTSFDQLYAKVTGDDPNLQNIAERLTCPL